MTQHKQILFCVTVDICDISVCLSVCVGVYVFMCVYVFVCGLWLRFCVLVFYTSLLLYSPSKSRLWQL